MERLENVRMMQEKEIIIGAEKSLMNAISLADEASVLFANKKYERAFFLAQISLEEIAKIELLGRIQIKMIWGNINWEKEYMRILSHQEKNLVKAYYEPYEKNEQDVGKMNRKLSRFVKDRNKLKNQSMYVGVVNKKFTAPFEIIKRKDAHQKISEAFNFIKMGKTSYRVIREISENKEKREFIKLFKMTSEKNQSEFLKNIEKVFI